MTGSTRFQGAQDVVFTAMEDEAVLLHLGTRKYYGLNETGTRIWQLVQIGSSLSEMAQALAEEYEVSAEEALEAVTSLCSELLDEGLIRDAG